MIATREARKEQRRGEIVSAAIAVFSEKGFHRANVSDIASRAGVSQGTVYLYFDSKEKLLQASFVHLFDAFAAPMHRLLAEDGSPAAAKLRQLAALALDSFMSQPELSYLMFQVMSSAELARLLAHDFEDQYRQFQAALLPLFQELGDPDPAASASMYMAALDGLALQAMLAPGIFDRAAALSQIDRRFSLVRSKRRGG